MQHPLIERMIKGLLIVNSYGGLIYNHISTQFFNEEINIDKIIAMASTIYTAMEILIHEGLCKLIGCYKRLRLSHERLSITALKTQTGMIFIIIHDNTDKPQDILAYTSKAHSHFVNTVLYSPEYYVEDRINKNFFALEDE
ncbi:uncharacterized protein NESG_01534 [Nematocida ausubeli]|uniref:Trafficking protein particle complex subunit n=2 Tax=Nematocida ausubeli (strain ATCC PRA-371 / ERTm2) TaxID=1913371 RepID=A0A086J2P3_NEMA1|nr:uncharacterized protein NESG_01534 [Nematocida ausubeli]KFG26411.1 hypothetical protein NESG_01534 [Nematocida ausubeli]